jgi:hypothetical protein
MKALVWLAAAGVVIALIHFIRRWRRQWLERKEAAGQRMAMFIAQAKPAVPTVSAAPQPVVAVPGVAPQERLLLEAATKAGEAGEPALCIQLYAKLLSRYPQSSFAAQARAAVEAQKKKLAKP